MAIAGVPLLRPHVGKKKNGLQMIQQVNAASAHINAMDSAGGLERLSPGRRSLDFSLSSIF